MAFPSVDTFNVRTRSGCTSVVTLGFFSTSFSFPFPSCSSPSFFFFEGSSASSKIRINYSYQMPSYVFYPSLISSSCCCSPCSIFNSANNFMVTNAYFSCKHDARMTKQIRGRESFFVLRLCGLTLPSSLVCWVLLGLFKEADRQ